MTSIDPSRHSGQSTFGAIAAQAERGKRERVEETPSDLIPIYTRCVLETSEPENSEQHYELECVKTEHVDVEYYNKLFENLMAKYPNLNSIKFICRNKPESERPEDGTDQHFFQDLVEESNFKDTILPNLKILAFNELFYSDLMLMRHASPPLLEEVHVEGKIFQINREKLKKINKDLRKFPQLREITSRNFTYRRPEARSQDS